MLKSRDKKSSERKEQKMKHKTHKVARFSPSETNNLAISEILSNKYPGLYYEISTTILSNFDKSLNTKWFITIRLSIFVLC